LNRFFPVRCEDLEGRHFHWDTDGDGVCAKMVLGDPFCDDCLLDHNQQKIMKLPVEIYADPLELIE
jgi:hypothetical protein